MMEDKDGLRESGKSVLSVQLDDGEKFIPFYCLISLCNSS